MTKTYPNNKTRENTGKRQPLARFTVIPMLRPCSMKFINMESDVIVLEKVHNRYLITIPGRRCRLDYECFILQR